VDLTNGADPEGLLRLADALAAQLEARAEPVRFRVASSSVEVEAIHRLRFQTVVASGWAAARDFPDGLERDAFDDRAVHIGGWDDEVLAASARLVFPAPGLRLPTEEVFDVSVLPAGRVVDVGRGIVAPPYRQGGHRVLTGLLARCWLELRSRGLSQMCGDAAGWLLEVYRGMGFEVEVLGPARLHWGEERLPIRIDGVASVLSVLDRVGRSALPTDPVSKPISDGE
jgi:Acetyltransferase (GNAT) domain